MGKLQVVDEGAAPKQPSPQLQSSFTKWITRVAAVLLLAATFTWLDGIKVSYRNSSTALTDFNRRIGGMF